MKERWIELDEKRGNEHSLMKTVQKHMDEAEEETGISPRGQLYTYDMFIDMLNGDFNPLWNINKALQGNWFQGISALQFAEHTPKEILDYNSDRKTEEATKGNRRLDEEKQIRGKKPKVAPSTYDGVMVMFGGACNFYTTYFASDSNLTIDYFAAYQLLKGMANFQASVPTDAWRTIVWLAINSNRGYFGTRVNERHLAGGRGLPQSNLAEQVRALRTYKHLNFVEGVPDDWYTQSGNEDTNWNGGRGPGGRDGRDKHRQQLKRNGESRQGITPHSETHPQVKR